MNNEGILHGIIKAFGWLGFAAIVLLAATCAINPEQAQAQPAASQPAPLGTPTARATVTPTGTATQNIALDATATAVSLNATQFAIDAARATMAAQDAQRAADGAKATQTAMVLDVRATATQKALYTAQEATRQALLATVVVQEADAQVRADNALALAFMPWLVAIVAVIAAAVIVSSVISLAQTKHAADYAADMARAEKYKAEQAAAKVAPAAPLPVRVDIVREGGANVQRLEMPLNDAQMQEFAEGIAAGKSLTFSDWVGTSLANRTTFTALREWLVENGFALRTKANEIILNDSGRGVIAGFVNNE